MFDKPLTGFPNTQFALAGKSAEIKIGRTFID